METTEAKAEVDDQVRLNGSVPRRNLTRISGPSNGGNSDTKYYDPARNAHLVR